MSALELPSDLFPDGDPDASVEMPRMDESAKRWLLWSGIGLFVGYFVLAWLLAQLRSTLAGFLFVPIVLGSVVWWGTRLTPFFAREERAAMAGWQARTGMRWIEQCRATEHPAAPLAPIGPRPSIRGKVIEGRIWRDMDVVARLGDASFAHGRQTELVTLLSAPVDPAVAARIDGLAITFGSRVGDLTNQIEVWFARWRTVSFERSDRASRVRVRTSSEQGDLATWELFDPAVLVRLEQRAEHASSHDIGMLITDGMFIAWCDGQFVDHGAREYARHATDLARTSTYDVSAMDEFLQLTGEVYRRIAAEHR